MSAVAHEGVAYPFMPTKQLKLRNSKSQERINLLERHQPFRREESIDNRLVNREFVREKLIGWLNDDNVRYHIHAKENIWVDNPRKGEPLDVPVVVSFNRHDETEETYRRRWEIETMFHALKSANFNIEDLHLTDLDRIGK